MGADASVELVKPFSEISKWPKARVESVLKNYQEGEYDFGIDVNAVMNITGMEADEAKDLLLKLSKSDSGVVNVITLLIVVLSIGNSENRDEAHRLEHIFDLMDFNHINKISYDEMCILLLCVCSAWSFVLEGKISEDRQTQYEQSVMSYGKLIYETLNNKRQNSPISKDEFVNYVKDQVFNQGSTHINDIYQVLITYNLGNENANSNEESKGNNSPGKK